MFKRSLAALFVLAATGLINPSEVRADATATSLLSFTNISVTPSAGTFVMLTNWSGAAFAQATVSNQFNTGVSPTAGAGIPTMRKTGSRKCSGFPIRRLWDDTFMMR